MTFEDELRRFLQEDVGTGDITSEALLEDQYAKGFIVSKEPCTVAGLEEVAKLFEMLGLKVERYKMDGESIPRGEKVLTVEGRARDILCGERVALNILMRMSGIATMTKRLTEKCRAVGSNAKVAGTRKTVPGFRRFDKKAIAIGGGDPHRMGLYDAILIKDNHLKLVPMETALERAKRKGMKVEVEVGTVEEALTAAKEGADRIMLDNMSPEEAAEAARKARLIKQDIEIEVSGGITEDNIHLYAPFADLISVGSLTHSVKSIDFSLELEVREGKD